ncbi:MAG TPA: Wzz/FepE/Etk N-terminal domain-containing protein [Clostridia bacterium]|nr:Wzz/FepE/Etk N-terminal domain-containing protein [Clostridia bacterium]
MEEIDIKELLGLFWSKKIEIIIIAIVFTILGTIYSFTMVTPKYEASTTLVLASLKDNASESITQTDITINSKLVATYSELVKSKTVLREALTNLNLEEKVSEETLRNSIKVKAVEDTEIIKITVENEEPEIASNLANEIARIFSVKVVEIYNINNVYVVDRAENSANPANINHIRTVAIAMVIGFVIGFAEVLVIKLLDNKIRTEQDIEGATELLVLGVLPKNEYFDSKRRTA